jgi:hypothetical protein
MQGDRVRAWKPPIGCPEKASAEHGTDPLPVLAWNRFEAVTDIRRQQFDFGRIISWLENLWYA